MAEGSASTNTSFQAEQHGSFGVRPMSIEGRMARDTERLAGMTPAERAWRRQWLLDQRLSPKEPTFIARDSPELLNPIRRAFRWPLDKLLLHGLRPYLGEYGAKVVRFYTGKFLIGMTVAFVGFYYFKYNMRDWQTGSGWRMIRSRRALYAGDEGYPNNWSVKDSPRDYNDRGFKDSIFGKKYNNDRKFRDDIEVPELVPFTTIFKENTE